MTWGSTASWHVRIGVSTPQEQSSRSSASLTVMTRSVERKRYRANLPRGTGFLTCATTGLPVRFAAKSVGSWYVKVLLTWTTSYFSRRSRFAIRRTVLQAISKRVLSRRATNSRPTAVAFHRVHGLAAYSFDEDFRS